MKYDVMERYREYLQEVISNKNTADRYYFAVNKCFKKLQFNDLAEINTEYIEKYMEKLGGSANFSALKNGLKHLRNFDPSLSLPEEDFFEKLAQTKRRGTKKGKKTIYLDSVQKKINALRDNKFKLGYKLMQLSGLRVSELANLKKEDIQINNNTIEIDVKRGKGGTFGKVVCDENLYLSEKLRGFLENFSDEEHLFHSAKTMKNKALSLGIECHDLRRIAAITHRNKLISEGIPFFEANRDTKNYLRHKRFSTTKRYLFNKKLKFKESDKLILQDNRIYVDELKDKLKYIADEPESIAGMERVRLQEKEIVHEPVEYAYIYDELGNEILKKSDSSADSVSFALDELTKLKNNILTHNHPSGNTFSKQDVWMLQSHDMKEIRAAGKNGTFFLRRVNPNNALSVLFYAAYVIAEDEVRKKTDAIYKKINDKYDKGGLTYEAYEENIKRLNELFAYKSHEWLKDNAIIFGYQYGLEKHLEEEQ